MRIFIFCTVFSSLLACTRPNPIVGTTSTGGTNGATTSGGGATNGGGNTNGATNGNTNGATTSGGGGNTNGATNGNTNGATTSGGGGTNGATTGSTTGGGGGGGTICAAPDCAPVACTNTPTTVTGTLTAPNGIDPVANGIVYVPSAFNSLPDNIACEPCGSILGGTALVSAHTRIDGSFTLENVPAGSSVPIVLQKGHFRRLTHLAVTACEENPLAEARLPSKQSEGDLPHIAVGVGDYDQIECVLRSAGIDDSEFTAPGGGGAVELYENGEALGGFGATSPTAFDVFLQNAAEMRQHQLILINCTGNTWDQLSSQSTIAGTLASYLSGGGRLYASDWSYDYLEQQPALSPDILFDGGGSAVSPQPVHMAADATDTNNFTATVGDSNLASWLGSAAITITDLLGGWVLMDSVSASVRTWLHGTTNGADRPLTVSFNQGCGKVLFSSFHAREPGGADSLGSGVEFPTYCKSTANSMLAQEKALEYLLLETGDCQ